VGVAALGVLVVLGADTFTDASGLVLGGRTEHLCGEPAARRVEVDMSGSDRPDLDADGGDELGQLDEAGEPSIEPVEVVGDDHVDLAGGPGRADARTRDGTHRNRRSGRCR
jgi:hypothetical protein